MATTFVDYTGDGNATKSFSFPSFKEADIKVDVDGVVKTSGNHYNITSYTTTGGGNVVFTSGNIPSSPAAIRIFRDTDVDTAKATFTAGSAVKAGDLNNNITQILYAAQEEQNQTILTSDIKDAAVTTAKIQADAVTGAKIVDDAINSEHYAVGSIDTEHIADSQITTAKIGTDAVTNAKIADDQIDSEHYVDGSIDTAHIGDSQVTTAKIADTNVTTAKLAASAVTTAKITDANVTTAKIADSNITTAKIADDAVTADKIADAVIVTNSEQASASANDTTFFTTSASDARYFNVSTGDTIKDGDTFPDNDTSIATTAAINDRIIDLIDDVGGFTAIANQTSFPTTNPQGTTGQAAILSIKATTATLTPSGTTVTIANGAGSGNTVTITGVSSTIPSGFGFLVESTSTTHTYTFHRLVPKATEVTTVAGIASSISTAATNVADINNFADIYQIAGSAPTARADSSSLQDGDLWFNNSNDDLRVWNGSAWAIITPSQSVLDDVAIVSGAITYSEDLGLITASATTGSSNGSLDLVADILEDEITFTVTAATGKFIIDGEDKPALTLYKGWTYTFDLSDASNATHPLRFSSGGSAYSTNVTVTGTQGQAGAKVAIKIPESQPTSFAYYCTAHSGMGNTITVKDDPLKTVSDSITNITAVANNSTNINAVAGNATNINTVAGSESNINRYADEYVIQSGTPSSPSAGDLWYNTTSDTLNFYNGSAWTGISPGISGVINDSNPALANHLDCNDKNLTEVGTVSGDNLQIDFGTIA